jgi:hypothetical protein
MSGQKQLDDTDEGDGLRPAVRRIDDRDEEGNVAGSLTPRGPLEPEEIDPENALFVLLGVVSVTVFVVAGISGL